MTSQPENLPSVDFSPPVRWLLARGVVACALFSVGASYRWWAAAGLIACVWIDAAGGWFGHRRQWAKTRFYAECELLADFLCFVWAPAAWVTAQPASVTTRLAVGVFVLAGAFRLARFRLEGHVAGGYRGLPVTYNGYAVPIVGGLVATVLPWPAIVWPAALLLLSAAMISTRFVVPEF